MSTGTELADAGTARDLVPGDPVELRALAANLTSYAEALTRASTGFAGLTVGAWRGPAADAFRRTFDPAPGRWHDAADAFACAARAVAVFAARLDDAQVDAARALALWQRGTAGVPFLPAFAPGADDPGAADRASAVRVLAEARDRAWQAAALSRIAVDQASSRAPAEPSWWSSLVGDARAGLDAAYDDVVVPFVNLTATIAQAAVHDPRGSATVALGTGLVLLGAAGDVGGGTISVTGVGAVVGVPAIAASTGLIVVGAGVVAAGGTSIGYTAAENPVEILETRRKGGSGDPPPPRVVNPPRAESPVWNQLRPFRGDIRTNGLPGRKCRFYTWDNTHNDMETWARNGDHLGTTDPTTGEIIKPPNSARNLWRGR